MRRGGKEAKSVSSGSCFSPLSLSVSFPPSASQLLLFDTICPLLETVDLDKNVAVVQFTVQSIRYVNFSSICPPFFLPLCCHCVPLNLHVSHLSSCVLSSPMSLVFLFLSCSAVSSPFSGFCCLSFSPLIYLSSLPSSPVTLSLLSASHLLASSSSSFLSYFPLPFRRSEMKSWRSMARAPRA